MKTTTMMICTVFTLMAGPANAQWGMPGMSSNNNQQGFSFGSNRGGNNWGGNMMPWGGGQSYQQPRNNWGGNMMPWGGGQSYQQPRNNWGGNMMPWGGQSYQQPRNNWGGNMMPMPWGNSGPAYRGPSQQPFGGGNMPWGGGFPQPQAQPQSNNMMMPGMEQGIRTMMAPGKVMADEATPSMMMTPTWR